MFHQHIRPSLDNQKRSIFCTEPVFMFYLVLCGVFVSRLFALIDFWDLTLNYFIFVVSLPCSHQYREKMCVKPAWHVALFLQGLRTQAFLRRKRIRPLQFLCLSSARVFMFASSECYACLWNLRVFPDVHVFRASFFVIYANVCVEHICSRPKRGTVQSESKICLYLINV